MKTEHYGLKLWGAREGLRREEVNGNFEVVEEKIDGKIGLVMGTYTGTGTPGRVINVGFQPRAVILSSLRVFYFGAAIQVEDCPVSDCGITITENGFKISTLQNYYSVLNEQNQNFAYIVFY